MITKDFTAGFLSKKVIFFKRGASSITDSYFEKHHHTQTNTVTHGDVPVTLWISVIGIGSIFILGGHTSQ